MSERLFAKLESFGDRPCLIAGGRRLTYSEVAAAADRLCARAPDRGLAFILAHDSIDAIAAYVGALRRGLAVHLLDPAKAEANDRLIALYAPDVLIDTRAAEPVRLLTGQGQAAAPHPEIAILLSTSGSTGTPKFVKLTTANIAANTAAICSYLGMTPADRGITSLRFFYSYGMSVVNAHLAAGASLVVTDLSTDDPGFWDLMLREGVTNLAGVPFTFELMARSGLDLGRFPALRLMTQAGGKLAPDLVRHFAEAGAPHGIGLCVMYGQTEAGPRMSWLPPELAARAPDSIGRAIPGGRLSLVDEGGQPVTEVGASGELVYEGPNVMAGYALGRADLAVLEDIPALRTGDIARFDAEGLFYITGRASRFVKPFGLRISLDEIEQGLRDRKGAVAVTGTDDRIVVALEVAPQDGAAFAAELARRYGLPQASFLVVAGRPVPRLASGKPDYRALLDLHLAPPPRPSLLRFFLDEVGGLVTGRGRAAASVYEAYRGVLGGRVRDRDTTFRQSGGDSLTYMQIYLALEEYLGAVPEGWDEMTISELEHVKGASFA